MEFVLKIVMIAVVMYGAGYVGFLIDFRPATLGLALIGGLHRAIGLAAYLTAAAIVYEIFVSIFSIEPGSVLFGIFAVSVATGFYRLAKYFWWVSLKGKYRPIDVG